MAANDIAWQTLNPQGPLSPAQGQPVSAQPAQKPSDDVVWQAAGATPPVTQFAQSPTAGMPQTLTEKATNLVGTAVEKTGAGPALEAVKKYAVDPFEKLSAAGAEVGRIGAEGLVQTLHPYLTAEETEKQHPLEIGIARGVGATAGGIVADPRNWPFMTKAAVRPILSRIMSAGFTTMMTKGAHDALLHLAQNWDNMTPAERTESATESGLTTVLATTAALHTAGGAVDATKAKFKDALTPKGYETKQVGPAAVPVRPTGMLARAAEARAPEVAQQFLQEKTAPAVAQGVSQTVQEAAGIPGQHPMTVEDPYGLASMADTKAKEYQAPVQRIDALSGNAFSNAQMARERVSGDFSTAGKNEWKMQSQILDMLWEAHRPQLEAEGVDVDAARKAWGQKAALDTIEKAMRKTTDISADPDRPYDLKAGKTLGTTIKGLLQHDDAPFQKLFGSKYSEAKPVLENFARTLNEQSQIAGTGDTPFDSLMNRLSRRIIMDAVGGTVGATIGGPAGGVAGAGVGEALNVAFDKVANAAAKWYLGKALTTPKATELLTNSLTLGADPEKTGEQLKTILHNSDPSWTDNVSQKLAELWHSTTGEAGLPGTVKPNIEKPEKPLTLHHWSNEDLTETNPEKFGTGKAGAERAREKEPGFLKRTYFADEGYKEPTIQGQKYHYTTQVDPTKFYDIAKDPEGIWQKGLREGGPTEAEKAVHDAGYTGYQHDGGYVSFEKHAVTKVSPKVAPDEHGFAPAEHSEYAAAIKANPQSATLTQPEEMTNNRVFSNGKGTFYSITPDGDIQGLVNNNPKDIGAVVKAERSAIANGGKTLDAWDLYLPKIYAKLGFENTELVPYDEKTYGPPSDELKEAWKKQGWKEDQPYPGVQHMKVTDEALRKFGPKAAESVQANASGESAASLEAQSRLKTQQAQGLRVFDVDSRKAGSKDAWHPVMSTVDRVDQQAQPFHHLVSIDKDGKVDVINSGEGAKPLPADEHIRQLTKQAVGETPKTFARSVLTRDGVNDLLNNLGVEGLKIVGSVAKRGKSLHDVDLLAASPEAAAKAKMALEARGFEWMGGGGVSPKEAARSGVNYGDKNQWSVNNVFQNKATGEKLEVWHKDTPALDKSGSEIGTRYPTSATAVISNDPSATTGLEALNEADRQAPSRTTQAGKPVLGIKQKLVAALADYKDNGISHLLDASDPDAAIEKYIEHVKGNLKWLHNVMPEAIRGVARHWYESAHDITKEIADKNNVTHEQAAAVTAALSPKNDWNNNIGQAKRLIEHYANDQQHAWTPQIDKTLSEIRNGGAISAPLQKVMDTIRGKTYDQLTAKTPEALLAKKAIWFRVLDEAHSAKDTPIYGPDGTVRGSQNLNWGQVDPIAKALAILEDGSLENINSVMGEGHKIRNFYNNIINPWSKRGHTTIDTHAVGAALTKPFSQEDLEVAHNFGSGNKAGTPSPARHAATGLRGSYAVHEEAYRRAAAELGLQPRELQSITWEGIRSLLGGEKKTPELRRAINEIWRAHESGDLTLAEAREKILEQAGGFAKPEWASDEDWEKNPAEEGSTEFNP